METQYDGIKFRSRNEAAWYAFFKMAGASPIFEPECFELKQRGTGVKLCNYLPDFKISVKCCTGEIVRDYVEIKSNADREGLDIAKACLLGYEKPTIIIVGWPLEYSALCIMKCHKGSPDGYWGQFSFYDNQLHFYPFDDNFSENEYIDRFTLKWYGQYPDENGCQINPINDIALLDFGLHRKQYLFNNQTKKIASAAWNATQWQPSWKKGDNSWMS